MEPDWTVPQFITGSFQNGQNKLAIWGRECSLPDLHQEIDELIGKNNSNTWPLPNKYIFPEHSQNFFDLYNMATWGKFSPIPHPWTNLEVFATFLSYQLDAFFSYFYTLKDKNLHRIQKLVAFAGRTCIYQ